MNKFQSLFFLCVLVSSLSVFGQTETINKEKVNLNSPSSISLFQSQSPNGIWASGTIVGDRWGIFEDATSSKERLTIIPGGNIGIGTTSPQEKLHINGSIRGNASGGALRVQTTGGYIDLGPRNDGFAHIYTDRPKIIFNKDILTTTNAFSSYNNDLILKTKGTERLRIDDVNGNIGIGTTSPTEKLDVNGTLKSNYGIIDASAVNGWIPFQIGKETEPGRRNFEFGVRPDSNSESYFLAKNIRDFSNVDRFAISVRENSNILHLRDQDNFEFFGIQNKIENNTKTTFIHLPSAESRVVIGEYGGYLSADGHKLVVKDGTAMIENAIYTNGEIGIGTTNTQGYKLAVAGKIAAEEVKVALQANWPDYVFKDNYKLPTLQQVEAHIATKGHLINIPSAEEVAENGIQLGEMNAKLLEKIEELTLYTIAQEKKLKEQEKINNQLKKNNQNLEARLAKIEALLGKE